MATKKYLVKPVLMSILTAGIVLGFSSCRDDLDFALDCEDVDLEMEDSWAEPVSSKAICNKPAIFISNGGNVPGELRMAINTSFPNKVGSLDEAEIAFVDGTMTP